jgi:hypothetical protein
MLGSLNNDGMQDPYYENGAVQLCGRDSRTGSILNRFRGHMNNLFLPITWHDVKKHRVSSYKFQEALSKQGAG